MAGKRKLLVEAESYVCLAHAGKRKLGIDDTVRISCEWVAPARCSLRFVVRFVVQSCRLMFSFLPFHCHQSCVLK